MVLSVRGARPFEPDLWSGRSVVVGRKFNSDGTVRRFRGNTVISFVAPDSPLGRCAGRAREVIETNGAAARLTFLPSASYHVTVVRLVCDEDREPAKWSSHLGLRCPLQDVDAFMADAMALVDPPAAIEMQYRAMSAHDVLAIELEPASPAERASLNSYRDAVAEATGVRHSDHHDYVFHLSLAYRVGSLGSTESLELEAALATVHNHVVGEGPFILPAPVLTFFDDMFEFRPDRR